MHEHIFTKFGTKIVQLSEIIICYVSSRLDASSSVYISNCTTDLLENFGMGQRVTIISSPIFMKFGTKIVQVSEKVICYITSRLVPISPVYIYFSKLKMHDESSGNFEMG